MFTYLQTLRNTKCSRQNDARHDIYHTITAISTLVHMHSRGKIRFASVIIEGNIYMSNYGGVSCYLRVPYLPYVLASQERFCFNNLIC
jgi:hypothetical protein